MKNPGEDVYDLIVKTRNSKLKMRQFLTSDLHKAVLLFFFLSKKVQIHGEKFRDEFSRWRENVSMERLGNDHEHEIGESHDKVFRRGQGHTEVSCHFHKDFLQEGHCWKDYSCDSPGQDTLSSLRIE